MTQSAFVLIIEDDLSIRDVLVDLLTDAGYRTQAVTYPEEAAPYLAAGNCHLILSDLSASSYLPHNREEVWEKSIGPLRTSGQTPIVVLTAHSAAGEEDPATVGVAAILTKPFQVDELLATVESVLAGVRN